MSVKDGRYKLKIETKKWSVSIPVQVKSGRIITTDKSMKKLTKVMANAKYFGGGDVKTKLVRYDPKKRKKKSTKMKKRTSFTLMASGRSSRRRRGKTKSAKKRQKKRESKRKARKGYINRKKTNRNLKRHKKR